MCVTGVVSRAEFNSRDLQSCQLFHDGRQGKLGQQRSENANTHVFSASLTTVKPGTLVQVELCVTFADREHFSENEKQLLLQTCAPNLSMRAGRWRKNVEAGTLAPYSNRGRVLACDFGADWRGDCPGSAGYGPFGRASAARQANPSETHPCNQPN